MSWQQSLLDGHSERQQQQLWRSRKQLDSAQSVVIERDGKTYLNFCSNDYLGLANHPAVVKRAREALEFWGTGSGASHLVCGHQQAHHLLEEELAEFVGAERALLFSTGYMANLAVPQSFLGKSDALFQDKLNHASLLDSAKLTAATFKRYKHADMAHLEALLCASTAKRKMISTDAVFSMDGNLAPIEELDRLAAKHNALLLIDDAHGLGVLGHGGRGTYSEARLKPSGHRLLVGTLGKALGSFGAFVAGDKAFIQQLEQHARSYIYTTALPAAVAEATRAALDVLSSEPSRLQNLKTSIRYVREGIQALGLKLMPSDTPIQPILLGSEAKALEASKLLDEDGLWVSAIRPPTVPKGSARLRITLSADHRMEHLNSLLTSLARVRDLLI